jgi:hypothetical protein
MDTNTDKVISAYFLYCHSGHSDGWQTEAEEIKTLNPDKIVCWCSQEIEYWNIFSSFFETMSNWLEQNNKIINLITPHLDGVYVRSRVYAEKTTGYITDFVYYYYLNNIEKANQAYPRPANSFDDRFHTLYTCYINTPQYHRQLMIDSLARDNLLQYGIATYRYPEASVWKYHNGSRLMDEPDFELHNGIHSPNQFPESFHKGLFDIVCESRYSQGEFFVTEKTLKSIMLFKPFIPLSCQGYQKYLEDEFGLLPYTEIFDYTYDQYNSIPGRVDGIIDNVKRLNSLNINERVSLYNRLIPKLVYNKNRIIETFFNKNKIFPESLKFLIDGTKFKLQGCPWIPAITYGKEMGWIYE